MAITAAQDPTVDTPKGFVMTRRRSHRRARPRLQEGIPPKFNTLLVVLLVLGALWLYQNGYFDRFLTAVPGIETPAVEAPELREDGTRADPDQAPEPVVSQPPAPSSPAASPEAVIETAALRGFRGPWYQVYFTKPAYPERPANRFGGVDETIAADIDRAVERVDLAIFDLDLSRIVEVLVRARERGLAVRVAIDGENLETPEVAKATGALEQVGIPVFVDQRDAFMHNKFLILDNAVVWTGSANLTVNDVYRNNNNMLRIVEPGLAANYTAKMDDLMAGSAGTVGDSVVVNPVLVVGEATVTTLFAPDDPVTSQIVTRLNSAQQRIDVLAFAYTSDPIAAAMIAARERGVAVRGVVESRNSKGSGSDFQALQKAGIDIHGDGNCYIMHNKTIIIDGQTVITGSFNFTRSAETQNDENVLIIDESSLAARYAEEFERVYAQALQPTRCG